MKFITKFVRFCCEWITVQVKHLEPWEKGTRKIQGMTGMCGGVRGVGAGGVVSSAFCLLFRFFNLRMNRFVALLLGQFNIAGAN